MSYKFDSLMKILNMLDSGKKVTVHSLMDDLEISERSVHRYLQTLQIGGFPVHYDRKKESYVFVEKYSLRKPVLSVEETLSLALAKQMLGNFGSGMEKSLNSIEEKLSVKKTGLSGHIVLKAEPPSPEVGEYLEAIHQAIINFQRIRLIYKTLYSNKKSTRKIDPYYLFFSPQEGFWHLRAYCHLRKELRTFDLDRIISLKVLDESFVPINISQKEELSKSFGTWLDGKPVEVVLRFDSDISRYITRKKWHKSQKEKELKNGQLEVSFKVTGLDEIKEWIYKWLPHVEVIAPKELKTIVKKDLQKALQIHLKK
ncbi:HTH domain protein [bacterium BMS3Bbin08]|nr:HTH domain protein [bacterium BMS3Bbin08]